MGRGPSSAGIIRPIGGGRFQCEINLRYRQYRKQVTSVTDGRKWINDTLLTLEQKLPPLTTADMIAASTAKAELPPETSLSAVVAYWVRHHKVSGYTVEHAADAYLADKKKAGLRSTTLRNMKWHMQRLKAHLGAQSIKGVERQDIEKAFDALGATGVGRDDTRRSWKGFWSWAIKAELTDKNPLEAITAFRQDDLAPGILSPEEVAKLLSAAASGPVYLRAMLPYLAIGFFSGIRTSEICLLTWNDIDLAAGHILVGGHAAKTRNRRYVTINDTLRSWLQLYTRRTGLLVKVQMKARITRLIRIRDLAKVKVPNNAMRHSFCSYHLAMWQDASKTAFELGHSKPDLLYRHYRNLVTKEDAETYWRLTPDDIRLREKEWSKNKSRNKIKING